MCCYLSSMEPIFRVHLDECILTKRETNKSNELFSITSQDYESVKVMDRYCRVGSYSIL